MKIIHKFFHDEHGHTKYFKVYVVLLILLLISYVGPMFGIRWLMLVTAFGIAIVKTIIVGAYFMHLDVEKKYICYLMLTVIMLLFVFFGGTAGDIMNKTGSNWVHEEFVPGPAEYLKHYEHGDGDHATGAGDDHAATGTEGSSKSH